MQNSAWVNSACWGAAQKLWSPVHHQIVDGYRDGSHLSSLDKCYQVWVTLSYTSKVSTSSSYYVWSHICDTECMARHVYFQQTGELPCWCAKHAAKSMNMHLNYIACRHNCDPSYSRCLRSIALQLCGLLPRVSMNEKSGEQDSQ